MSATHQTPGDPLVSLPRKGTKGGENVNQSLDIVDRAQFNERALDRASER